MRIFSMSCLCARMPVTSVNATTRMVPLPASSSSRTVRWMCRGSPSVPGSSVSGESHSRMSLTSRGSFSSCRPITDSRGREVKASAAEFHRNTVRSGERAMMPDGRASVSLKMKSSFFMK